MAGFLPGYAVVNITPKEEIIIHDKALTLVKQYQEAINKIGKDISDITLTKTNIEKFVDLYVNRKTMVYNDLDPAHKLSEFYEIETYASNLALWYPDGQSVFLDMGNATVSDIMEHGENIYSIDVVVTKKINGNYINKAQNTNTEKLLIRIAFVADNQKPDKFKIAGIRSATGEIKPLDNLSVAEVKSVTLDKNEILKIENSCKTVASDYTNYFSLLGSEKESSDDKEMYKSSIKQIFLLADNNIYNDLVEKPEDKYIGIEKYIQLYSELYPSINNISLNTDSATFSKIIKNDDNTYTLYMYVNKFFSAKQKGKDLFRFQNKLIIKLSFINKNGSFTDYKIVSIDNLGISEALTSSPAKTQDIKTFKSLPKLTRKGTYVSFNLNAGFSNIVNKNIEEIKMGSHSHEWEINPKLSYGASIRVLLMFNDLIGFETGLSYQSLKTNYSLSSAGKLVDQDIIDSIGLTGFVDAVSYSLNPGEYYYKIIQVPSYDSAVSINTITVPLYLNFKFGQQKKISFTFKTGFDLMYTLKSTYSVTGQKKFFIYIPDPAIAEKNFHFWTPEDDFNNNLGLYDKTIDKQDQDAQLKKLGLNWTSYLGVNVPLGYFLSFNAGVIYKVSLKDISPNVNRYVDIFGETGYGITPGSSHIMQHKPIKVQQYLIEMGITYKF